MKSSRHNGAKQTRTTEVVYESASSRCGCSARTLTLADYIKAAAAAARRAVSLSTTQYLHGLSASWCQQRWLMDGDTDRITVSFSPTGAPSNYSLRRSLLVKVLSHPAHLQEGSVGASGLDILKMFREAPMGSIGPVGFILLNKLCLIL